MDSEERESNKKSESEKNQERSNQSVEEDYELEIAAEPIVEAQEEQRRPDTQMDADGNMKSRIASQFLVDQMHGMSPLQLEQQASQDEIIEDEEQQELPMI